MEQGRGNARTAEDLEWNVALADLIQGVEQAKGAIERVDLAVQRVRIAGQCRRESEPRLLARITLPVDQTVRYVDDLENAVDDLVREQAADHAR